MKVYIVALAVTLAAVLVSARPQQQDAPEPYDFQYKVEDPPIQLSFGANEAGDASGKVTGSYYVLLPDGRVMTVDYVVDGESGFQPKISFNK
ncbi:cuticle protein-like [Ctenocephalides felis]|uniref:cuticle protein-like n=1 Tax=Ctenocephalides felis TaxID=7515 RepID=UPI000E6E1554|nr:cuticle protein-like [Ctenocephalides felis]